MPLICVAVSFISLVVADNVFLQGRYTNSITASARQLDASVEHQLHHAVRSMWNKS
jgi:hypothetical protein